MPWVTEKKAFIVEAYFRHEYIHVAQLQFKKRFGSHAFLSTQRSMDGSTSSEPIKLCKTSTVKILTDNHTLDNQNCSGHRTTLRLPKTLLAADRSPSKSVLRRSQELRINRKTVCKLLVADLNHWSCYIRAFLTD